MYDLMLYLCTIWCCIYLWFNVVSMYDLMLYLCMI